MPVKLNYETEITSVNLPIIEKKIAHDEGINLSELLSSFMIEYFSKTNIDEVNKRIQYHTNKLKNLEKLKEKILTQHNNDDGKTLIETKYWNQIKKIYLSHRLKRGDDDNIFWLESEKNQERLKMLRMNPYECLERLKKETKKEVKKHG